MTCEWCKEPYWSEAAGGGLKPTDMYMVVVKRPGKYGEVIVGTRDLCTTCEKSFLCMLSEVIEYKMPHRKVKDVN